MGTFTPPRIFTRDPVPSRWNPDHLARPYEPLTLREWEQSVISCSLSPSLQKLLLIYWSAPANAHCRRSQAAMGHWQQRRASEAQPSENGRAWRGQAALVKPWLDGAFSSQTALADFRRFVRQEIAAIWYLLDTPFLPCSGMSRAMLLVAHGQYLREMLNALTSKLGALPVYLEAEHALLELMGRRPGCEPWQAQPERTPSLWTMQLHHLRLSRQRV